MANGKQMMNAKHRKRHIIIDTARYGSTEMDDDDDEEEAKIKNKNNEEEKKKETYTHDNRQKTKNVLKWFGIYEKKNKNKSNEQQNVRAHGNKPKAKHKMQCRQKIEKVLLSANYDIYT